MIRSTLQRMFSTSTILRPLRRSSAPFWAIAFLALSALAHASVVFQRSIEEMTLDSELVVRGTVESVESRWDGDHRRIHTYAEIRIVEPLKGQPLQTVRVRQPGGVVGDVGQRVEGAALFQPGEDVVVFLQARAEEPAFVTSGMAAGKVLLTRSSAGQLRATRRLNGLAFYDLQWTAARPADAASGADEDLGAAETFLARVRQAVQSQKAGAR